MALGRLPSPLNAPLFPGALALPFGPSTALSIPTADQPHQLHPTSPAPRARGVDFSGQAQVGPGPRGGAHREDGGGETPEPERGETRQLVDAADSEGRFC